MCLSIVGNSTAANADVDVEACDGEAGQVWRQQAGGALVNPLSGLCLADPGDDTTDGTQLQVQGCEGGPGQQWMAYDANFYPPAGVVTVGGNVNECLDVLGDDTGTSGTAVDVWDCQPQAQDQHWLHDAYNDSLVTLGLCLSVIGNATAPGSKADVETCNGEGGQKWLTEPDGALLNPQSGQCLDDPSGNQANGTQLQIWYCNGESPQLFDVTGGQPIVNTSSDKCLDVLGDDAGGNGSPVDLWGCQTYAVDQHWTVTKGGQLETLGKCLDIDGNSTAEGTKVELWTCDGVGGQVWRQQANGSLVNPQSGLCLDDPGSNTTNGTQLQIWDCNGTGAQDWLAYDATLYPPAGVVTIGGNANECLDVLGDDTGTAGTAVDVWTCQPQAQDQHWLHNDNGSLQTLGLCLDTVGESTAQGALADLNNCNGSGTQQWAQEQDGELWNPLSGLCLTDPSQVNGTQLRISPCTASTSAGGGEATTAQEFAVTGGNMVAAPGGQCMDVLGDDTGGNGSPVDLWGCQPYAQDQHWAMTASGALSTLGECLDTAGGGTTAGTPVVIANCDGSKTQVWIWQTVSEGTQNYVVLMNLGAGLLCLTDPGDNTANGTQLQLGDCSTSPSQTFYLW